MLASRRILTLSGTPPHKGIEDFLNQLVDTFGRKHDDLRISVTDRCNLRCSYCMPEEPIWFERDAILSYEEQLRLVRIFLAEGVRTLRLTGGEPLVRKDLDQFVSLLAAEPQVEQLSLTTNAILLAPLAKTLKVAGLTRINVSLDTLVRERFQEMTRRDRLKRALEGIRAAAEAGLTPIKVNTVLLRGVNDDEVESLVGRAREEGWEIRFIEFMPLENGETWNPNAVIRGAELRERIHRTWPIEREEGQDPQAPATRYRFSDGRGRIGFIDSVSEPFCSSCRRLRLTSDGKFRVCLYDDVEADLRDLIRGGATDLQISEVIHQALQRKGRGGAIEIAERQSALPLVRTMHQIGG